MSSLTSKIYESILQPETWSETLSLFAQISNAKSSVLLVTDDTELNYKCVAASTEWSRRNLYDYSKYFFETEVEIFRRLSQHHSRNFILDAELQSTNSHYWDKPINKWMQDTLGVRHRSGAGLHEHHAWIGVITLQYSEDRLNINSQELAQLNKYVRHFSRAIEVSRTLSTIKNRYGTIFSALNHLEQAIFLLNSSGELIIKNNSGTRLLESADGLSLSSSGRLEAYDLDSMNRLTNATANMVAISEATSEDNNEGPLLIKRRSGKQSYIIDMVPLIDTSKEIDGNSNGVLVFAVEPDGESNVSVSGLAKLYGLTQTEQLIAKLLASGKSTLEITEIRNTSLQTTQSQVKSILRKTACESQAKFVRLAYILNPPIR